MYNYTKPIIVNKNGKRLDNGFINCEKLRHPIVERINDEYEYIPHDIKIGRDANYKDGDNPTEGMLIYGINSSGKSVLMKAIGLSIVMAQVGMFVPASKYEFSPYDSLFARITGNDNLFKGLSSYALEMTELNAILKRTGPKTLVIGDEVCRGTEYVSGNAIVASTLIRLSGTRSSFIFATHLHDIAKMERIKQLDNIKIYHLSVNYDEKNDVLVFDRKLKLGSGEEIYGITVAKYIIHDEKFIKLAQEIKNELLGVPNTVLSDIKSNYNSNLFRDGCYLCGRTDVKLETHHINFQKNCKDGFVISKPHIKMNSRSNLVNLCEDCHHNKIHKNKMDITRYVQTSSGKKLEYKIGGKCKLISNYKTKKKYGDDDVNIIEKLKNNDLTKLKAKKYLKDNHGIDISTKTITKIWNGLY